MMLYISVAGGMEGKGKDLKEVIDWGINSLSTY
jgi:hypothetical protein